MGVVHKKMPYDGVQVCIRTIQVCAQVYKASMSACSYTDHELPPLGTSYFIAWQFHLISNELCFEVN